MSRLTKCINPNDSGASTLHRSLRFIRRRFDLTLGITIFDRREHPSHGINLLDTSLRFSLNRIRERLDHVASTERIRGTDDTRLLSDDLLSSKRQLGALLCRKTQRLIESISMKRLRPAQNRGHRLKSRAHHVVQRLLRGQRTSRRLGMKTKHHRAFIFSSETLLHDRRPQTPSGSKLSDLFQEIVVRVKEERDSRSELIDRQAPFHRRVNIRDSIG